jgi:hypothetical protein
MEKHESFGLIGISRFSGGGSQFFGSDLIHDGGIVITIKKAEKERKHNSETYYGYENIIRVELSGSQFVDAITSGMNTQGVPCTIKRINGKNIPQVDHVTDKKEQFSNDMKETHEEYFNRINNILKMLDGDIGRKRAEEIKKELSILKSHIKTNTNFVMECFNENMEKTVTEAKHSVSNYIDNKINSLGIEGLKNELKISIEKK